MLAGGASLHPTLVVRQGRSPPGEPLALRPRRRAWLVVAPPVVPATIIPAAVMPAAVSPAAVSPTAIAPPAVAPVVPERPEERDVDSDIRPGDAFGAFERHPSLGADRIGHRIANGAESLRNRR